MCKHTGLTFAHIRGFQDYLKALHTSSQSYGHTNDPDGPLNIPTALKCSDSPKDVLTAIPAQSKGTYAYTLHVRSPYLN